MGKCSCGGWSNSFTTKDTKGHEDSNTKPRIFSVQIRDNPWLTFNEQSRFAKFRLSRVEVLATTSLLHRDGPDALDDLFHQFQVPFAAEHEVAIYESSEKEDGSPVRCLDGELYSR